MIRENRILLVEPNPKLAEKNFLIFRKEGFVVNITDRASEAIRTLQEEHFSVVVMDVSVTDMAWSEAIPIIKGLDPTIPIIMTSNENTPELEVRILRQKPFYYHVKSFGTEELILAVKNAAERSMPPG